MKYHWADIVVRTARRQGHPGLAFAEGFLDGRTPEAPSCLVDTLLFGMLASPTFGLCPVTCCCVLSLRL